MRIWILFCFLASSLAEKEDEEPNNLNDVGVIYSNVDLGVLPIYPFDAFNIGYDIFLREPHPPLLAAINPKSNQQDSEISEKKEDYETSFPSTEQQRVIVSSSISGSSSKDSIVSTTVSSQNLEQIQAEVSPTADVKQSSASFASESVLQSTGESVQVSITSEATVSSSVSSDSEKRSESQTVKESVSISSTLSPTSSESKSVSPERGSEVKGEVELTSIPDSNSEIAAEISESSSKPAGSSGSNKESEVVSTSVSDSKSQTVIKESIDSGLLNSASSDSSSGSSKKESVIETESISNSRSSGESTESTSYSSRSPSSTSTYSSMDSHSEKEVISESSKEFVSQPEARENEGQTVVFPDVDMPPPPSTEEHTTLPMNSEEISTQTAETVEISEAVHEKRVYGLDIPSIRDSLKIGYTELAQIKKMLFKRKNVLNELNQVITNLEVLCDKICLELPEKYMHHHSFP